MKARSVLVCYVRMLQMTVTQVSRQINNRRENCSLSVIVNCRCLVFMHLAASLGMIFICRAIWVAFYGNLSVKTRVRYWEGWSERWLYTYYVETKVDEFVNVLWDKTKHCKWRRKSVETCKAVWRSHHIALVFAKPSNSPYHSDTRLVE